MKLYKHWNGIELHAENEIERDILVKLKNAIPADSGVDTTGYETCDINIIEKSGIEFSDEEGNLIIPHSDILIISIG